MRTPNITRYSNSTYQLGNHTSNLKDANEVVATEKRINSISDDPMGISQVLNLNTTLGNLEQINKNVKVGISWLDGVENALDSVNGLILDVKSQVSRLVSASASVDERKDAIESINGTIEQIVTLGNTKINGSYIFAGTDATKAPFVYHDDEDPPRVSYEGNNDPFKIKTDNNVTVKVGRDGQETFWDDAVEINSTNNTIVFKEDNGHGTASEKVLTAIIPEGEYTTKQLTTLIKNNINEASSTKGYGATYDVVYDEKEKRFSIREDGSFDGYLKTDFLWDNGGDPYLDNISASSSIDLDGLDIQIVDKSALTIGTPEPLGSKPFKLTWDGTGNWLVENNPGYVMPASISGTRDSIELDFTENGVSDITIKLDNPVEKAGEFIEFEIIPASGDHSIGHEIGFNAQDTALVSPVSDFSAVFITDLTITAGTNDSIDFVEVDSTGTPSALLTATISAGNYTDMDDLANEIKIQMDGASVNGINYAVSYDSETSRFSIREDGTSLNELNILWSNSPATASTLGFYPMDDSIIYPLGDVALDLSLVLDESNNSFSFRETSAGGVQGNVLTASVSTSTYRDGATLANEVQTALNNATENSALYQVTYDAISNNFTIKDTSGNISELELLWDTGDEKSDLLANALGFNTGVDSTGSISYTSNNFPVVMAFDETNNKIDFSETDISGNTVNHMVEIPQGNYQTLDQVATAVEDAMKQASWNKVDYSVSYDSVSRKFSIDDGGGSSLSSLSLLWETGENRLNSAAEMLGFDGLADDTVNFSVGDRAVVNITLTDPNNKLDFREVIKDNGEIVTTSLTAAIELLPTGPPASKTYSSHAALAKDVEKALNKASLEGGNRIDYSVSWDDYTKKFSIKENGSTLEEFDLLWQTGANAPASEGGTDDSIGSILGFDAMDDIQKPVESNREVSWGIFDTLIDLKDYLADDDTDGIERTLGRLETQYDHMTSRIADTGIKYNRLQTRESITSEVKFTLTERRSSIEDADIIEAVMNLKSIETAYEASLSSTSMIMKVSLVDYM